MSLGRSDDTALFQCLNRALSRRCWPNHFAVFQPPQERIASEQIRLQLIALLDVRNKIEFRFRKFRQNFARFFLRHRCLILWWFGAKYTIERHYGCDVNDGKALLVRQRYTG